MPVKARKSSGRRAAARPRARARRSQRLSCASASAGSFFAPNRMSGPCGSAELLHAAVLTSSSFSMPLGGGGSIFSITNCAAAGAAAVSPRISLHSSPKSLPLAPGIRVALPHLTLIGRRRSDSFLRNAIDLVSLADGQVTLSALYDVITQAPQRLEDIQDSGFHNMSACWQSLERVHTKIEAGTLPQHRQADFDLTLRYFTREFPALAEKTRSVIVSMFTSMADGFLRSPMRELFCTTTNIVPELTHQGTLLVLDLPVLEFGPLGQRAQVLMKRIWQQATERRPFTRSSVPVFLWADESQYFVTKTDAQFQSTARSAQAATVYLTQNLPTYYAVLGDKMKAAALLGNLNTKLFHCNGDPETNRWAADTIARDSKLKTSINSNSQSHDIGGAQTSDGVNISNAIEYQLHPITFTRLKTGGPSNHFEVTAIVFQAGRIWKASNKTFLLVRFNQQCNTPSKKAVKKPAASWFTSLLSSCRAIFSRCMFSCVVGLANVLYNLFT